MNSCTSVTVKRQCIGLVTVIVDGESQSSKEVMNHIHVQIVQKDILLGYLPPGSKNGLEKGNVAVMGPLDSSMQQPHPLPLTWKYFCC